ncbi:MAG TPA: TetR/AcrR family transcriptional regulator [Pseudonocardia sp.]|uniref:TetR/AcrR family transcriptional regulator n=1 Tax=Pseudonocardia sp. TaxID=60912 RepID=UPI002F3F2BA3
MARRTAARIAEAALAIVVREGAEAVSMRRVAAVVGVTPMAIYRHYPNRDALMLAVAEHGRAQLAERCRLRPGRRPARAELKATVNALLDFALEQPRLYALLTEQQAQESAELGDDAPALGAVVAAVDEAMHREALAPDDVDQVAVGIVALMHGLILLYLSRRLPLAEPEFRLLYAASLTRLLNGIST